MLTAHPNPSRKREERRVCENLIVLVSDREGDISSILYACGTICSPLANVIYLSFLLAYLRKRGDTRSSSSGSYMYSAKSMER